MIRIRPSTKDLFAWAKCVPIDGDLLFLAEKDLRHLPAGAKVFSAMEAKQDGRVWSLNSRSWYGYSMNVRSHCAWLKPGTLERLSADEIAAIAKAQIAAGVPTLIRKNLLPVGITKKSLLANDHVWITSAGWKRLTNAERISVMRAWFVQNELIHQPSLPLAKLSAKIRARLRESHLDKLLHTFRATSGGNCFAVAAAFATRNRKHLGEWMHWFPLKSLLCRSGYNLALGEDQPQFGDILVFQIKNIPIHAAIYLGEGIWFEKAGQDFYEPYRLVEFNRWRKEWPGARLMVFRKV